MPNETKLLAAADPAPFVSCGLVMPISALDGCTADHWAEVKAIVQDAVESIENLKVSAKLVSDADDVGVIQKRIVQGIYSSDIVICDVSGRNANVMFELGMRLAFDKPTLIIKDDKTDYAFDTAVIEHVGYPRDLRFPKIVMFKKLLAEKVVATYAAAKANPDHSTFLKNFGTFSVAHLDQKEASGEQLILEVLGDLQKEVGHLRRNQAVRALPAQTRSGLAALVATLIELRAEDNSVLLEPGDALVATLISKKPSVANPYASKDAFVIDLQDACSIVSQLPRF